MTEVLLLVSCEISLPEELTKGLATEKKVETAQEAEELHTLHCLLSIRLVKSRKVEISGSCSLGEQ